MSEITNSISNRIDELEAVMLQSHDKVDCPLTHSFIPGYYARTVEMPAGTLVTSRIHNTEHAYHVSKGVVYVKINDEDWEEIQAPYWGMTQPGTRRVLYIESTCTWTTFHATEIKPENNSEEAIKIAVNQIDELILEPHINPILNGELKNNSLIKNQLEDV